MGMQTLKEKHTLETMLQSEREQRLIESFDVAKRQQGLESDLNTVNTMRDQKIQLLTNTVSSCVGINIFKTLVAPDLISFLKRWELASSRSTCGSSPYLQGSLKVMRSARSEISQ